MRRPDLESIVVVGPPCGGKDTLLGNIAEEFEADFVVPQRVATRDPHSEEKAPNWLPQSDKDFEEGVANGMISPDWRRSLDIYEAPKRYGFLSIDPDDKRGRIYGANYPFAERPDAPRRIILAKAMFLVVTAHPDILHDRLDAIGPEMSRQEKQARSRKIDQNAPQLYRPAEIIDTSNMEPEEGQELFRNLIIDILNGWAPRGYSAQPLYLADGEPKQPEPETQHTDSSQAGIRRSMSPRRLGS